MLLEITTATREDTMTAAKQDKTAAHVAACEAALKNVAAAVKNGQPVDLADAKVLEAAGCWLRRNAVS